MLLWQKVFSFVKGYNKSRDAVLYVVVTVCAAVYYFMYYLVKNLMGLVIVWRRQLMGMYNFSMCCAIILHFIVIIM